MTEPFTFYVVQFAHTDIGYTHPQDVIRLMYIEIYDRVLELCEHSREAPEPQRFKWVVETAWQVRHYLEHRPEREAELVDCVRRGQIEITANYLHFTDLIDADALSRSLTWAVDFCRRHAVPLKASLHCDINGWPWGLADALAEHGLRYFASAVHIDMGTDPLGPRGSIHYHWLREWEGGLRQDAPVRVPQAFWWQGPAGGRVLHWLGEHYHLGNVLGLSSHYGFHAEKSRRYYETDPLTVEDLYHTATREVPRYLDRIRADGYSLPAMLMPVSGFWVDNSPPDDRWCGLIARWNAEQTDIKLRTATLSEWFERLEALQPDAPVRAVAWPDGWAHGLGSMTARVAQGRRTQRRRQSISDLVQASCNPTAKYHFGAALEQERLALEHTFDAWCTTAMPAAGMNSYLQATKELTFHRAEMHFDEAGLTALRALVPHPERGRLWVPSDSNDWSDIQFSAPDLQPDPDSAVLVGPDGRRFRFQREASEPPMFAATLPGGVTERRAFHLMMDEDLSRQMRARSTQLDPLSGGALAERAPTPDSVATELRSNAWALAVDAATGALTSLVDRTNGVEWAGAGEFAFGQLVREFVVHPLGREAVGNLGRLSALGIAGAAMQARLGQHTVFARHTPVFAGAPRLARGPVFDALELTTASDEIGALTVGWRLYHRLPLVELVLEWNKPWDERPEAVYVSFPFAGGPIELALETGGGFFQPGRHTDGGQLAGTVSSYYTVQRAARLSTATARLLWLPLDAPLVMTQRIDFTRWETDPYPWNGFLASMPVNHYWHTNFPTNQRGPLRLRYRLINPAGFRDEEAALQTASPVDALGWR